MMLLILAIISSVFETHVASICVYYLVVLWLYLNKGLDKSMVPIVLGGIVLDVLTPRPLGVSAFLAITVLFVGKNILNLDERSLFGRAYILLSIIGEGLVSGRSYGMIVFAILVYLLMVFLNELWGSRQSGIVVRREI